MSSELLRVEDLRVELARGDAIVEGVSLNLRNREILGLVGESGSGKTTAALALLGYARRGARIVQGSVRINGRELRELGEADLRPLRGKLVSYVPQDPAASLNPALRIGDQICEVVRTHLPEQDAEREMKQVLERVHLPSDRAFQRRFPHQLSGGQQQRVAIALALVCRAPLVVMDEPTTGLDVVTQAHILDAIRQLRDDSGLGIVYVSHDLAVVGNLADRIAVLYGGWLVEEGPTESVLHNPRHPYTHGLIDSIPDLAQARKLVGIPGVGVGPGEHPEGCPFWPRCPQRSARAEREMPPLERVDDRHRVRCFDWRLTPSLDVERPPFRRLAVESEVLLEVQGLWAEYRSRDGLVVAARDVSLTLRAGEAVALVGESGSGKTTIARCVAGLHRPSRGQVLLNGLPIAPLARDRPREARRRVQIVFQNPYDSLNPRHRIGDAIAFPARLLRNLSRKEAGEEALTLLDRVRLPSRLADRYPRELSGGERQRAAIARALAANPDLLICDEITSALDVSVQAAVIELIEELRRDLGLSLLFISHDLGVVASVADYGLVLQDGILREEGPVSRLVESPTDDYTRTLLEAAPRLAGLNGHDAPETVSERG